MVKVIGIFPILVALGAAAASGQVVYEVTGNFVDQQFGRQVVGVGDWNGDGVPDFAASTNESVANGARVRIHSGIDGAPIVTIFGSLIDLFGADLAAGDITGDGKIDLLIGAPAAKSGTLTTGRVMGFENSTNLLVLSSFGSVPHNSAHRPIAAIADRNGDGKAEVLVGTALTTLSNVDGRLDVLSGATGSIIATTFGSTGESLGNAVSDIGDVDSDGTSDYAASAVATPNGRVYFRSGLTDALLQTLDWGVGGDKFGTSIAGIDDATGDSVPDVAIGIPNSNLSAFGKGAVVIVSGATGSGHKLLLAPEVPVSGKLGTSVAFAGDVDGDGHGDVLSGAPFWPVIGKDPDGFAVLFSGASGLRLNAWRHHFPGTQFGASVGSLGDVNGDGVGEIMVGAPTCIVPPGVSAAGLVRIIDAKCAAVSKHGFNCVNPSTVISATINVMGCVKPGSSVTVEIWGHAGATAIMLFGTPGGPTPIGASGCWLNLGFVLPIVFTVPLPSGSGYAYLSLPNTLPSSLADGTIAIQLIDAAGSSLLSSSSAYVISIF